MAFNIKAGLYNLSTLWLLFATFVVPSSSDTFTVGYLTNIYGRTDIHRQGLVISGAIGYAIDRINRNTSLLGGHKLRLIYNDTKGDVLISAKAVIDQYIKGAVAFFGPDDSCEVEATVAASLNLPMISYKCADSKVSKKEVYRTFARTHPPDTGVVKSIIALLRYYRWYKFSIVSYNTPSYQTIARNLEESVTLAGNFTINSKMTYENFHYCCEDRKPCCNKGKNPFFRIVEETYKGTRAYVFLGSIPDLIGFMIALHVKGMLDSGHYVVIYIDMEAYMESQSYKYLWSYIKEEAESASEAAKALLVIVPTSPADQNYVAFTDRVLEFNEKEPFDFKEQSFPFKKYVTMFAFYLYDSVMLYADALGKVLREGGNSRDGVAIIQKIIQRKRYESITGAWMQIDENGDVEGNYTVLARQHTPENLKMKGFDHDKNPPYAMLPVGGFFYEETSKEPIFRLEGTIDWIGGRPPLDEPPCGYDGMKCKAPPDKNREIAAGILASVLITVSVIAAITYRNWKYEQEIAGLLWRIAIEDILKHVPGGTATSSSKTSLMSQVSLESKVVGQVYTQTALYKGTLVAVKQLRFSRRTVDITRQTKKEMKAMRAMHHDNINQFIGACVEPNCIYIVTEYCSKGSLQDILENDDLRLDSMFIASLVFDLIKGMLFLHKTEMKVHGNLKSSNCVVTSRWVLQITDFGLHELRNNAEVDSTAEYQYYKNLFWKAPEFLRDLVSSPKGTQKGDVYAFAIILHEIIVRQGPFGGCILQPKEIISKVKHPVEGEEPFRPPLHCIQCQDYILQAMKESWNEQPELRPDFRHLRERLEKMRQGMKPNIMDNMVDMMEKYANNLEELVDERTAQLVEEQKRTEALLHRMVPKSVAEQLMRGESVIPESFDAVTIYFSDIVGFTEMSASSTPMEVVTFLNDLYTVFDAIISHYDVYKVETIGDAYMVVSGLPIRNSDHHAAEIATMALELLDAVRSFRIRHRQSQALKLRIGIHTGPVVAGVVGLTMPRYCLFGDTVNTASRMESTGEALKIHISHHCKEYLEKLGGYILQERGIIKVKGKGDLNTYWLHGQETGAVRRRQPTDLVLPQPLFSRDIEARRRSPKMEYVRRGSSVAKGENACHQPAFSLPNGSVAGLPAFLRMTQESPRVPKRFSPQVTRDGYQRPNSKDTKSGGCNDCSEEKLFALSETSPNGPEHCSQDFSCAHSLPNVDENYRKLFVIRGDTSSIGENLEGNLFSSEVGENYKCKYCNKHCREGYLETCACRDLSRKHKTNSLLVLEDSFTPLVDESEIKLQSTADKNSVRRFLIPLHSKRWRSYDEMDYRKGSRLSLRNWFTGLFLNKLVDGDVNRTGSSEMTNVSSARESNESEV